MSEFLPGDFIERERRRTVAPDPTFARRVVARLQQSRGPTPGVWEYVPGFARQLVALATVFLALMVGLGAMAPNAPDEGIVDAYLADYSAPAEAWLFLDNDLPVAEELFVEIAVPEVDE